MGSVTYGKAWVSARNTCVDLDDAHDDRDLHLERIEKGDLVVGIVPHWVDSPRVRRARREGAVVVVGGAHVAPEVPMLVCTLPMARSEEGHRVGERLIIADAHECAKEAIEQQNVPSAINHLEHVGELLSLPFLLLFDEPEAEEREEDAVPKVSKHDAEEIREEDAAKGARVGLAVARRAVRVDERLEAAREAVRRDVGWRREPAVLEPVDDRTRVEPKLRGRLHQPAHDGLVALLGHPPLGDKHVPLDVKLALVERIEDHLLLDD